MKSISNQALVFIAAGCYLMLGGIAGYLTANTIVLLVLGVDRFKRDRNRLAAVLIAIAVLTLIINEFGLVVAIVLISLGLFYRKTKPQAGGNFVSRHRLLLHLRLDRPSWILRSMAYWHAFGESRVDLTMAVPEERETTVVLQGIVGDAEWIVPEDYGLQIEASVLLGQIHWNAIQEGGVAQKVVWRSPDYEQKEHQVKLQLFYLVGNIRIRQM
ncbi:cell wall-active antibiotics response protein LiaF [Cohnella algarum]|uniref:cell wall-active antibiotics response protein LiaF n=1 Tax=Cohnella algarum TaxID=2044859 RepID=UPI0019676BE4|nr:cell wall-active antibiotics response protein LiaF [Cohnella algarum]MBN2982706.1 cell wall-active antibiotics response protein [Cohnella algarum]